MKTNTKILAFMAFFFGLLSTVSAGMRGLPFNNPSNFIQRFNAAGSKIKWAYNWDSYRDPKFPKNLNFVPMLHSNRPEHTSVWSKNAQDALARGSTHLMAFNEPDMCIPNAGGACMSINDAVAAYKKYMMPFAGRKGIYLGSPSVTGRKEGLDWLREFKNKCTGCQIDYYTVHWYDEWWNVGWLKLFLSQARTVAGGKNIWLTEFRCTGDLGQRTTFLKQALPYLDSLPWLTRYSWFSALPNLDGSLVKADGTPSDLGKTYAFI